MVVWRTIATPAHSPTLSCRSPLMLARRLHLLMVVMVSHLGCLPPSRQHCGVSDGPAVPPAKP
eukprot:1228609-Prorocentrum_lima.AAC.1